MLFSYTFYFLFKNTKHQKNGKKERKERKGGKKREKDPRTVAFVCSRGKEPGEQRVVPRLGGTSHGKGQEQGAGREVSRPPPGGAGAHARGDPRNQGLRCYAIMNNGGAFRTAGEESSGRGRREEDTGTPRASGLWSTWRTCGVKNTFRCGFLGFWRDGGTQGIPSLLPHPGNVTGAGLAVWGWWGQLDPAPQTLGGQGRALLTQLGQWGAAFPPSTRVVYMRWDSHPKRGPGLLESPRGKPLSPHVSLLTLPLHFASLEKRQAPTFPCCVLCRVVSVSP